MAPSGFKDMMVSFIFILAMACTPFILRMLYKLDQDIKFLGTEFTKLADEIREEGNNTQKRQQRPTRFAAMFTVPFTVTESLSLLGDFDKDAEFLLNEAISLCELQPENSTKTGFGELGHLEQTVRLGEAWVAKRAENNAMLRGVLGQKKKEIMEREERLAREKNAEAEEIPQGKDGESVGAEGKSKKPNEESTSEEL